MSHEKDLHNGYAAYLRKLGIFHDYHRPDKRTTNTPGWPDFQVMDKMRLSLFVEFKMPGRKLDPDQIECKEHIEAAGFPYKLCYSVEEAISATIAWRGHVPFFMHPSKPLDCQGISNGSKGKSDSRAAEQFRGNSGGQW